MSKIYPITEFDSMTLPGSLQIFKAIIPFMDYDMQCLLSKLIRTNELIHTMNFYKTPSNCQCFQSCSSDARISFHSSIQDILNNERILNAIMRYCPEETENMFHQFQKYSKMSDLFNLFDFATPPPASGQSAGNPFGNFSEGFSGKAAGNFSENFSGFQFDESMLLNPSQQQLYNDYIHKLDEIDLSRSKENHDQSN